MSDETFGNKNLGDGEKELRDGNSFSNENGNNGVQQRSYFRRERVNYTGGSYGKPRYNNGSERRGGYDQYRGTENRSNYGVNRSYNRTNKYSSYSSENHYNENGSDSQSERSYRPRYQGVNGRYNNHGGYQRPESGESFGGNRFNKRPYNGQRNSFKNTFGGSSSRYNNGATGSYQDNFDGARFGNDQGRNNFGKSSYGYAGHRNFRSNYNPHAKYSQKKRLEYKEKNYDPNEPVRLNKFLANAGVCSRRDADKFITSGIVTVNGNVVTELGTKILRSDVVLFHDQQVKMEKKVYVLLNKPKGYVTTSDDPQNRKTVMELVKDACPERIYPVGRLDRNTTGVLLFTNDGELAAKLTHPKFMKKKIYHVYTDKNVTAADIQQIADGITLEDGDIKADAIEYASPTDKKQVGIEIHSGKNRIVRRIFEHLGYHVVKLDRVYFAGLTKKNVKRGDWRYLTEKEVDMLRMGAFE